MNEAFAYPPAILTFADREELIKTLKSLPEDCVGLVGYVDEDDVVREWDGK